MKLIRVFVIMGVVVLSLGIVLCAVGFALGGAVRGIRIGNIEFTIGGWWARGDSQPNYINDFAGLDPRDVVALNIDITVAKVTVERGETFAVYGTNVPSGMTAHVKDGTLYVKENGGTRRYSFSLFSGNPGPRITVTVPYGAAFTLIDADIAAGSLTITGIAADYLRAKVSAGSINIKNAVLGGCKLTCSAGSIDLTGVITGDSDLSCSAGSIDISLDGDVRDYRFNTNVSAGSIRINNNNPGAYSGYNGKYLMTLQCSAGSITVNIK